MTRIRAAAGGPAEPGEEASTLVIWCLGLTQIIGYGTLYYSFSVLAPSMARDMAWPPEWIYGLFSAALLVSGVVAPFTGRACDRFGAAPVMALGSAMAAFALASTAVSSGPIAFALCLVATEATSTLVLYEAAFALLVEVSGQNSRRSITRLTLIAGFASTLFWPLTAFLHESLSWREVFLVFAGMNVGLCFPLHLWLTRRQAIGRRSVSPFATPSGAVAGGMIPRSSHSRALGLLIIAFALAGFVMSAILVHMVPLLTALGLGTSSVLVGAIFGPAQVLSRISIMTVGGGLEPLKLAIISSALLPLALVLLAISAPLFAGALIFAVLFGLGSGLTSIVRGTVPLALFGSEGYGARLGWVTSVRLFFSAVAPFAFAVVLDEYGPRRALFLLIVAGGLGFAALIAIQRMHRRSTP